jgi:hypothetical protein
MIVVNFEEQGVIASQATQCRVKGDIWMASSLTRLAMTDARLIAFQSKTFSDVIPDARKARDQESRAEPAVLDWLWIPGQAFGPPGMTCRTNGSTGIRMA